MRKILSVLFLLAAIAGASRAQSTNVSGQILDPNGFPYTNAVINVILSPAPSGPATCGTHPLQPIPPFTADVNGNFNIGLCPNASISSGGVSGGSQWQFNVSISPGVPPPAGFGPQSFSLAVTITGGSQDIGSTLSAVAPVLARNTSAGGVTSVGLSMPLQYAVSGSPVISSGILGAQWLPVAPGSYLGGPTANSVGGIFDGINTGTTGGSNSITITATPTQTNDLAFFLSQAGPFLVCGSPITMTGSGTWTNQFANGNGGALFTQPLTTNAPLTGTANCPAGGGGLFSGALFFLATNGTPTFRQSNSASGAISNGLTVPFTSSVLAGHSLLAVVQGIPASGTPIFGNMVDSQNNLYTPLAIVQDGNGSVAMAFLSANISNSGADTLKYVTNGATLSGGAFFIAEITSLAFQNGLPTFHPIPTVDLPAGVGVGVQSFVDVPQSVDVTVGTTNTSVVSQTVVMPSSGCPCRVQYSFSLWPEFSTFTNVPEISAWLVDGTTNFRGVQTGQSNASSGGRTSMTYSGWTTSTYTNSESVTFTLTAIAQAGGGYVLKAAPEVGSSANAGMSLAVFTSN